MNKTSEIAVCGRKWDSSRPVFFTAPEGLTLSAIVLSSIERAYRENEYDRAQYESLLKYARCRVDGVEIGRAKWASYLPRSGARIEILHGVRGGGGGGGGGKNPIATVLSAIVVVVAAVATWYIGGAGGAALAASWGVTQGTLAMGVGLLATGALMAINALFPAPTPSIGGNVGGYNRDFEKTSQTYSINGGRNTANVGGYVPLVCGRHRFTPPLGGRSWTVWEGEKQFFHMLVVWGHPDVTVSDFRIGETPLASFKDVEHAFHQSTTGDDLKYFAKSYREENVGAVIKQAEGWTSRVVGEAEAISIDFAFQRGLVVISQTDGSRSTRSVRFQVQYREKGAETWRNFSQVAPRQYSGGTVSGAAQAYVYAVRSVSQQWEEDYNEGLGGHYVTTVSYSLAVGASRGGDLQIWPSKSSGVSGCSVSFGVSGANAVISVASGSYDGVAISGRTFTVTPPNFKIFVNADNTLSANSGDAQIFPTPSGMRAASVTMTAYDGYTATADVAAGWYEGDGYYTFSAATQNLVMRNVRMEGLDRATYEVQMRRITGDTNSSYVFDEAQWSVMRAILNEPAFGTPLPICVSELRIRASEQLSGYVENFNALCVSNIPDWNGTAWETAETSNPASIMRYLLTSRHGLSNPYGVAKLDDASLVELWNYCDENGYEFNFICDSEENTWSRLVQVLAPGRAAPTTDVDGLWGVVIDRNGKTPVQLFTPRNSWGMSIQRGFADMPDALRVSFIDETDDYVQREGYVYNDGFSADGADGTQKAQNIIEWDFPGITNWNRIWRQGRLYMARALHRQQTITINTDWEWLACHRGDLVGVASDVLMNVFGVARVMRLVYEVDGEEMLVGRAEDIPVDGEDNPLAPVGVQLDDSLIFSDPAPARYGIAIRDNAGRLTTYELRPQYGEEAHTLYFRYAVTAAQTPPLGALCSVSLLGEEYGEYLVASITPGENLACELTLIPYKLDEIEAAVDGPIPPYAESVILDVVRGRTLPTPVITLVMSDESVLGGYTGASIPRIAAWWELPATTQQVTGLRYQLVALDVETGERFYGIADDSEPYVAVEGVQEGRLYDVRLRALNPSTGVTSPWSAAIRHVCIGRTTPPPPPTQVFLDGSVLKITQRDRPQDVVGHVVSMVMDEDDPFSYALRLTNPYTSTGTFDLSPWAGHARRAFVQAIDEIGLLSDPVSVAVNLIDRDVENVLFTISQREAEWAGDIVNGAVVGGILSAAESEYLWPSDANASLWPEVGTLPLWNSGNALQMIYTYGVTIPAAYAGANVRVEPQEVSGRLASIEYRVSQDGPLWPADGTEDLWSGDDAADLWPGPVFSDWAPFPSNYTASGAEALQFRLTYLGGDEQAVLTDVWTVIDVPDLEWAVEDLEIPSGGTHVPIPTDYFRAVTNVVATLQYRQGDTGVTATRVPASEVVGDNGFLSQGPVLLVLDAVRQATAASVDVRLKGY